MTSFQLEAYNDHTDLLANYEELKKNNITTNKLYMNERAAIIGVRAQQLELGAKSFIDTPKDTDSVIVIAERELAQKKIPFIIKRTVSNKYEYWKLEDLV
jgi:DNA-directed RNA polymerase subunit K/omega